MCSPVFAVTLVTSALQIASQENNARAAGRHQRQVRAITAENAAKAAANSYGGLLERSAQIRQAAAEESIAALRDSLGALSSSRTAAASGGIGGLALADVEGNIALQASEFQAARLQNLAWEEAQIIRSMESVRSQQENRNIQAQGSPIAGPDYGAILSNLFASGIEAYGDAGRRNPTDTSGSNGSYRGRGPQFPYDYGYDFNPYQF